MIRHSDSGFLKWPSILVLLAGENLRQRSDNGYLAAYGPAAGRDLLGRIDDGIGAQGVATKWQTLSIYEEFEQWIVAALTIVIAVIVALATWQLLLHTLNLAESHLVNPADLQVFQGRFGMVLTVLIALEFKRCWWSDIIAAPSSK